MTQSYQMEARSQTSTLPMRVADGATKLSSEICGRMPGKFTSVVCLLSASYQPKATSGAIIN
jgi:hypothetical protein